MWIGSRIDYELAIYLSDRAPFYLRRNGILLLGLVVPLFR